MENGNGGKRHLKLWFYGIIIAVCIFVPKSKLTKSQERRARSATNISYHRYAHRFSLIGFFGFWSSFEMWDFAVSPG